MLGIAHTVLASKYLPQEFLSLQQRRFAHIEAVAIEHVEKIVGQRNIVYQLLRRLSDAESILQFLEIAAPVFVECDDFAIKDGGAGAQVFRQILKLRKLRGDIAFGARK